MKHFIAAVEIWESDEPEVVVSGGVTETKVRPSGVPATNGPDMFTRISLPPKGNDPTTLAHELGHLVAHIYKTNASQADDLAQEAGRVLSMIAPLDSGDFKDAMEIKLAAEKEAWGIAHKIYPDLDPANEKEAIDSYEKGLKNAKF